MPTLDWTNIIIAALGIGFALYKSFVEPKLPAQKAVQVSNDLATLTRAATLVVQKVEQTAVDLPSADRKTMAIQDIKSLLLEVGAPIPSDEAISGAIESTMYLLNLAQGKVAKTDTSTRRSTF